MSGTAFSTDLYPTCELGPFARRDAVFYEVQPPFLSVEGVTPFVILASSPVGFTDVYAAHDDGRMVAWDGPQFPTGDHSKVLLALGYALMSWREVARDVA